MEKQTKNICRKKGNDESSISPEQLRLVLRYCCDNVQRYGVEAVLQNLNMLTQSLDNPDLITCTSSLHVKNSNSSKITIHDPKEKNQQNALFLIESFNILENDESNTLAEMQQAYEKENYDDVIDLAYLHDRHIRSVVRGDEKIQKTGAKTLLQNAIKEL